jgi:molybdate transport system ATP-binding protein
MSATLEVDARLNLGGFRLDARFAAPGDGITVLFGPSGSGKSTLLSLIAGLVRSDGGRIALGGRLCDGDGVRVAPHRRGIGLVFQDGRLFPHLTARQNILYARRRAAEAKRLDMAEVARFFDITAFLDRPVRNLSGGERSRVALARAMVAAPDFLLLDEPFAALDGSRRRAFIRVLLEMHRKYRLPMLVVTHDVDDAAALGSHLVALKGGQVVASGAFAQASGDPAFAGLLDPRDSGAAISARLLHSSHDDTQRYLWLRADHVLLAAAPPQAISARNVLEGKIASVTAEEGDSHLVALHTPAGTVLSRVTADAVAELALAPGKQAWALVKAHAL